MVALINYQWQQRNRIQHYWKAAYVASSSDEKDNSGALWQWRSQLCLIWYFHKDQHPRCIKWIKKENTQSYSTHDGNAVSANLATLASLGRGRWGHQKQYLHHHHQHHNQHDQQKYHNHNNNGVWDCPAMYLYVFVCCQLIEIQNANQLSWPTN